MSNEGNNNGGNMTTAITTTRSIEAFRAAFNEGLCNIVAASTIYVEALDEDPRSQDAFKKAFANEIPVRAWSGLEAVGRKQIHPKMLWGRMVNGKKATAVKALPYSTQERVFNHETFDLLCEEGKPIKVDMTEATPDQVEQLCDGREIRSLSAQQAWLEDRKTKQATEPKAELLPYTISGGKAYIRRGVTLTVQDAQCMVKEMKRTAKAV